MSIQSKGMLPHTGDQVHYLLDAGPHQGERRPAFIVRVWSDELVNLIVLVDGSNDYFPHQGPEPLVLWRTSVHYTNSDEPGKWTWDIRNLGRNL